MCACYILFFTVKPCKNKKFSIRFMATIVFLHGVNISTSDTIKQLDRSITCVLQVH